MAETSPTLANKRPVGRPIKESAYLRLVQWQALPSELRQPENQYELAKELNVDASTLSDWKKRDDYWDLVRDETKQWARDKTPDVVKALFKKAKRDGKAQEVGLWLKYFESWVEKGSDNDDKRVIVNIINYERNNDSPSVRSEATTVSASGASKPVKVQVVDFTSQSGQDSAGNQ